MLTDEPLDPELAEGGKRDARVARVGESAVRPVTVIAVRRGVPRPPRNSCARSHTHPPSYALRVRE